MKDHFYKMKIGAEHLVSFITSFNKKMNIISIILSNSITSDNNYFLMLCYTLFHIV